MTHRTSTKLLTLKQVEESFGWELHRHLQHDTVNKHLDLSGRRDFVEVLEFFDPAGKPIRCIFNGSGDVLYDPQHYAEYIRRQLM